MTFHVLPAIWTKEVGFEVDDSIRITESGYESLLCDFPMELFIK